MDRKYTEVFKMSKFPSLTAFLFPLIFFILGIHCILFSCINRIDIDKLILIFGIILTIISIVMFIKSCKVFIFLMENLYKPYSKNQYEVTQGEVKDLSLSKEYEDGYDSFEINGLDFYYEGSALFGPYCRNSCIDGFIRNNGQHIKIYYIPIKYDETVENCIVRLFIDSKELIEMKKRGKRHV